MRRQSYPRAFVAGAMMLTACTDAGDRLAPPVRPVFAEYSVIEDGSYSSYGRDVTFTMYGGYAEIEGPEVVLEQRFAEDHVWQGTDYDATVTFLSADNTFGTAAPEEIDVGRVYTAADGATTVYDRQGSIVESSDAESTEFENATAGGAPAYSLAPTKTDMTGTLADRPIRDKREPIDRVLITDQGRQRTLARLRATSQATQGPNGIIVFTRREGDAEVQEMWDPALGAIAEIKGRDGRGQEMRTQHTYERVGRLLVLSEEQTTISDVRGGLVGRFSLRYSNHRVR